MGLNQVDLGLDKTWGSPVVVADKVVLARGRSCSDKEGVLVVGSSEVGGASGVDLEVVQQIVNFLWMFCRRGVLPNLVLFVSE